MEFPNSAKMGGAEVLEAKPKPECHPHILQNARVEMPLVSVQNLLQATGLPSFIHLIPHFGPARGWTQDFSFWTVGLKRERNRPPLDQLSKEQTHHLPRCGANLLCNPPGFPGQLAVNPHAEFFRPRRIHASIV